MRAPMIENTKTDWNGRGARGRSEWRYAGALQFALALVIAGSLGGYVPYALNHHGMIDLPEYWMEAIAP